MTPMTPEERQKLLSKPGVTEADIDEYERLLAERMLVEPGTPQSDASTAGNRRIKELHDKLYG